MRVLSSKQAGQKRNRVTPRPKEDKDLVLLLQ
jgi:hypothetical protein